MLVSRVPLAQEEGMATPVHQDKWDNQDLLDQLVSPDLRVTVDRRDHLVSQEHREQLVHAVSLEKLEIQVGRCFVFSVIFTLGVHISTLQPYHFSVDIIF